MSTKSAGCTFLDNIFTTENTLELAAWLGRNETANIKSNDQQISQSSHITLALSMSNCSQQHARSQALYTRT